MPDRHGRAQDALHNATDDRDVGIGDKTMLWGDENHFRMLAATVADYAVVMVDTQGRIKGWNRGAEKLFGLPADDVSDRPFAELFCPEEQLAGVPEQELARALQDGTAAGTRWYVRADGTRFWGNGAVVPLFTHAGKHHGFGKVIRDESSAKELLDDVEGQQNELLALDKRKDVFLSTLAHEMRNPLQAIRMSLLLLRDSRQDEARFEECCKVIERQAEDLLRLSDDISDITRIATGKVELRLEWVSVGALLDDAAEAVQGALASRGHRLVVSRPSPDAYLRADPLRMRQVLVNLLVNAAKYTPAGGEIHFSGAAEGGQAVFRVRDSGVGLSKEALARVFDLFCQIDYSFERSGGGLGMGLSIVRGLVELHGGTVEVTSEGRGKGSEFVVRLTAAE